MAKPTEDTNQTVFSLGVLKGRMVCNEYDTVQHFPNTPIQPLLFKYYSLTSLSITGGLSQRRMAVRRGLK